MKLWDPSEFPQLAANEHFCLSVAQKCGLEVPPYRLAEDGMALVIDRFDLLPDGTYRGFKDFCMDMERLFTRIALNAAIRNGDAHQELRNSV